MAGATFSAYKLIRDLWPQKSIYDELFEMSPVLGIIPKDTDFGERIRYIAVGYTGPQGIASNFGDAKQYKTPSKAAEFQVQKRSYYGTFSIEGLLWRTYKFTGNKTIIVDPLARETRNMMRNMKNDLSTAIHKDGVGVLARITAASTPTSSDTVTLRLGADFRRFDVDMTLQTESTGATGGNINSGFVTLKAIGGTDTAPTLVVNQSTWLAGIPGVAASDYIYRAGTYDTAPFLGLDAWNPDHSGSPGTFLSVNRNVAAKKLAGTAIDATKMSPKQILMQGSRIVADAGFKADTCFCSTRYWENIYNDLSHSGLLRLTKVPAAPVGKIQLGVSYDGLEWVGPGGRMEILPDPWMPDDVLRIGQRDTCKIASLGDLVHWDEDASPDNPMLEDTQDSREVRCVGDMAFYSEAPFAWARFKVTT